MIRPLIVDEGSKRGAGVVAMFFAGAFASSATLGTFLGFLGSVTVPRNTDLPLVAVAVAGIVFATADLLGVTPTTKLQTKKKWWRKGPTKASLMWGLHLGAGFATIRVASLYWVVALAVFASASPRLGIAMGAYGAGLALNLAIGVMTAPQDEVHYPLHALR
jgi:hypothetical protein